jgi:YbbR domain-containing protein
MKVEGWLQKDIAVKAISVLIAVILWFQVVVEENPPIQKAFDYIPVVIENAPPGYVLVERWPETVKVVLKAPQRAMMGVDAKKITASIDLKKAELGQFTTPIEIEVPKGLEIVETVPSIATVVLDEAAEKRVPVEVRIEGLPSSEFQVGSPKVIPELVTVNGPKAKVTLVDRVVGRLDISGAEADFSKSANLEPVTKEGKKVEGVMVSPDKARVSITMTKLPPSKTLEVVPEVTGIPTPGYRVEAVWVEPGTVTVRAQEEVLQGVGRVSTEAVSIDGSRDGIVRRRVRVLQNAQFLTVDPLWVTVYVRVVEDEVEKMFEDLPVIIVGVQSGLKWSIEPGAVSVTLQGKRDNIAAVAADSIRVTVDARGLDEGTHRLPVSVDPGSSAGVKVRGSNPGEVTVTLSPRGS